MHNCFVRFIRLEKSWCFSKHKQSYNSRWKLTRAMASYSYYGATSDLKQAGRNIVSVEIIFPVLVILVNVAFLILSIFVFGYPVPDILDASPDDHLRFLSGLILIYGILDFLLGWFLFIAVSRLSPNSCRSWIILQLLLLATFLCFVFLFPFFTLSLDYIFWELICSSILLCIFKLYRLYVIHFLVKEIRHEGAVWKQQVIYD